LPSLSGFTSTCLIRRLQDGEAEAWEQLVVLYGPLVYSWCRRAGFDQHATADVCQDVFTAVHRRIEDFRFQKDRGSFRSWLKTITKHKLIDARKRPREVSMPADVEAATETHSTSTGKPAWGLELALEPVRAEFETPTWNSFWQVVVEQKSPADVAAELGLSRAAVYMAKHRVLKRLREFFAQLY
jgi:RNA polymerase sigma-70 factor (ECF subfamily)